MAVNKSLRPSLDQMIRLIAEVSVALSSTNRTMVLPLTPERNENVAEHSFSLALLACSLASGLHRNLDPGKLAQYAIAHDLVEVYAGDTSVWANEQTLAAKTQLEAKALNMLTDRFGAAFPWIEETVRAYESRIDAESRFVYALDKILPHISILVAGRHPIKPSYEDYLQRVATAKAKIGDDADLLAYFDELLGLFAERPDFYKNGIPQA